ncbi:GntR family transcriptional regulator [Streptomyces dioscori]|uniref:GntR family transcriptional regulator n=1 Tax=Streptomyces dioscori TaxID=2109333 RepID=A0A2P8Q289_9ACTN|nr:GntR family transcriptional regulator [Streptomyces dioscori]PSM40372.1 GntR family transcriptional regulator [Streptomyces dioscori]
MYEVLLTQLMDGRRKPGEPLNIGALSRELEVSQTPLREALARLEHSGLVQREALRGYFVAPVFTKREMTKLAAARELIEPAIAAESALRRTPEFLADLAVTIDELSRSGVSADTDSDAFRLYWTSDARFHNLIAAQADNLFLEGAFHALSGHVQRFRLFMKAGHAYAGQAADEHQGILDALASGDPSAAAEAMLSHVRAASERALVKHDGEEV